MNIKFVLLLSGLISLSAIAMEEGYESPPEEERREPPPQLQPPPQVRPVQPPAAPRSAVPRAVPLERTLWSEDSDIEEASDSDSE